jgi:peptidoglycan/LPS O-acetylase OafA/YrhL
MGYLRLFLALIIMAVHLTMAEWWQPAALAVVGFYAISGYCALAAWETAYKGRRWAFLCSRYLRLWPSYLMITLATWAALSWGWAPPFHWISIPTGVQMPAQLLMIVPAHPSPALLGGGWVLKWFLLGYVALSLGIAATPQRAFLWLVFSLSWFNAVAFSQPVHILYNGAACASMAFAVGATGWRVGIVVPRDGRWGAMAGAISYPLFLSHWRVAMPLWQGLGIEPGWPLFFAALAPTLALSWLLVVAVERPVQTFHQQLRANHGN